MQSESDMAVPEKTVPVSPYYIDEEMTTSFLATVEGGLSIVERVSQSFGNALQGRIEDGVDVSGGVPFLGRGRVTAGGGRSSETTTGEEWEFERQHTLISMLNLLRQTLLERLIAKNIDDDATIDLEIGDIVEFSNHLQEIPFTELKEFWQTYLEMRPVFADENLRATLLPAGHKGGNAQRSKAQPDLSKAVNNEERMIQKIIAMSDEGFETSGLLDLHIETGHNHYRDAILTLRLDSSPARSLAYSKGSKCTVIGKITGTVEGSDMVLMYRRSGLRYFSLSIFEEAFKPLRELEDLNVDFGKLAVAAPAIQVLPLAIFVWQKPMTDFVTLRGVACA